MAQASCSFLLSVCGPRFRVVPYVTYGLLRRLLGGGIASVRGRCDCVRKRPDVFFLVLLETHQKATFEFANFFVLRPIAQLFIANTFESQCLTEDSDMVDTSDGRQHSDVRTGELFVPVILSPLRGRDGHLSSAWCCWRVTGKIIQGPVGLPTFGHRPRKVSKSKQCLSEPVIPMPFMQQGIWILHTVSSSSVYQLRSAWTLLSLFL